jgi:flagellar motor switch protein FliM
VDFNPTLTFSVIDRLFGGHGKIMEAERELTSIERSVMANLVHRMYTELQKSWANLVTIEIEQKSFETNPQFIQIVPPGETVVVISFQIKLFQSTGLLTICYPYVSLEPIITRLSAQNWIDATKKKNAEQDRSTNVHNVKKVDTQVAAVLLRSKLKLRDFMQLSLDDIVPSEKKINESIEITVNNRLKFTARPGLSGKKRAFQVLAVRDNIAEEMKND